MKNVKNILIAAIATTAMIGSAAAEDNSVEKATQMIAEMNIETQLVLDSVITAKMDRKLSAVTIESIYMASAQTVDINKVAAAGTQEVAKTLDTLLEVKIANMIKEDPKQPKFMVASK